MKSGKYTKLSSRVSIAVGVVLSVLMSSCSNNTKNPGNEFMPDMYRSPSYESYGENSQFSDGSNARKPPMGSIARGYVPYEYANTFEDYEKAGLELKNPIAVSDSVLAEGKVLFTDFCSHCHGSTGNGDGKLVQLELFPPVPSFSNQLKTLPEGKMFHSITYGKNLMGSHASQLTQEERWKIVHFIKTLQ